VSNGVTAAAPFSPVVTTNRALFRLAIRQVVKGAMLIGLLAGVLIGMQGIAMVKTYTTPQAREAFAHTLTSTPALGVLYGEPIHVDTPAGYMLYRSLPVAAIFASVWALLTITRLLRGEEENGRWEVILSGQTTARQATIIMLLAGYAGLVIAAAVAGGLVAAIGGAPGVDFSAGRSMLVGVAAMAPAMVCMGIGALTSQLAGTRRRAVLYGLVVLIVCAVLRSAGNVIHSVGWLKYLTPFGWLDKLHFASDMRLVWFLPFIVLAGVGVVWGVRYAGRRDTGEGIIAEPATVRSHYYLLGHTRRYSWKFALRQTLPALSGWLACCVFVVGLIAGLSTLAVQATSESDQLTKAIGTFAGSDRSVSLAFISMGTFLLGMLLLLAVTAGMGAVRGEEASGRLDNFLVSPIQRTSWLTGRLALLASAASVICLVTTTVAWVIATRQGLAISFASMVGGSLNSIGPVVLLVGFGALVYGVLPRAAVWAMYALVAWSFILDVLSDALSLSVWLQRTSLLHYIALTPAVQPEWTTTGLLVGLGALLGGLGVVCFKRRDIEAA